jgi:hypothetical protein
MSMPMHHPAGALGHAHRYGADFSERACNPRATHSSPAPFRDCASDAGFIALQNAYRASGGLASGNELAARLHANGVGGYASLARWIVGHHVFSFAWNEEFWLPMFQFEPRDLSLRTGLHAVLAELVDVMDGWATATWFAQPNDALQGHSPVSQWLSDWPDVFQAARLQRFVMKG